MLNSRLAGVDSSAEIVEEKEIAPSSSRAPPTPLRPNRNDPAPVENAPIDEPQAATPEAPLPAFLPQWIHTEGVQQLLRLKFAWECYFRRRCLEEAPSSPPNPISSSTRKHKRCKPVSAETGDPPEKHRKRLRAYRERVRYRYG
ncbi:hypothetical protein KSP40_PGU017297 [Platanthera guangdongensis]|uniref:Uncharacterized protein n=1 Tax=Platanthera guangdongensis TaxID=2320717 RepID=A0ABR2LDW5_9ASPA